GFAGRIRQCIYGCGVDGRGEVGFRLSPIHSRVGCRIDDDIGIQRLNAAGKLLRTAKICLLTVQGNQLAQWRQSPGQASAELAGRTEQQDLHQSNSSAWRKARAWASRIETRGGCRSG